MQPVTLLREILHAKPQRNTHRFGKRDKTGKHQKWIMLQVPEVRLQKSHVPGESFLLEQGKWPCGSRRNFVALDFFNPKCVSIAKRSFNSRVISMLFLTPLQENCTLWEESALLWGREGWAREFAFASCVRSVPVMKENSSHLWKLGPRCENYVFR